MSERLTKAARRYRDAVARAAAARQLLAQANEEIKESRPILAEVIADEARGGMRPTQIMEITGYTREHVRTILRRAGVPPIEDE